MLARHRTVVLVAPLLVGCPSKEESAAPKRTPEIHASGGKPMPEGFAMSFQGPQSTVELPYTQLGVHLSGGAMVLRLHAESDTLGEPAFDGTFAVGPTPVETILDLERKFFDVHSVKVTNFDDEHFVLVGESGSLQIEDADLGRVEGTVSVVLHAPDSDEVVYRIEKARFVAYPNPSTSAESIATYQQVRGS